MVYRLSFRSYSLLLQQGGGGKKKGKEKKKTEVEKKKVSAQISGRFAKVELES